MFVVSNYKSRNIYNVKRFLIRQTKWFFLENSLDDMNCCHPVTN